MYYTGKEENIRMSKVVNVNKETHKELKLTSVKLEISLKTLATTLLEVGLLLNINLKTAQELLSISEKESCTPDEMLTLLIASHLVK